MSFARAALLFAALPLAAQTAGWQPLFDGKTLNGWTPNESPGSWKIVDGAIAADGARSHLFYTGPVNGASFKNFEFSAEVKTQPGANSGIYFHTATQPNGWLNQGYEVQVCNTCGGEGGYLERKKTGSLYGPRNVYKAFARDGEWFTLAFKVEGRHVEVRLNGVLLVDYVEPNPPIQDGEMKGRVLSRGTFALQCHDPGSKALFRNIRVRPLPDSAGAYLDTAAPDARERQIVDYGRKNIPMVDYHVHLKGRLTLQEALALSRRNGIMYGVAVNVGKGFPVQSDEGAIAFFESIKDAPVFTALQGEGREWQSLLSPGTLKRFDYVFTDSMTWTNDNGKRMRLWIKSEVEVGDPQDFMEQLVDRTVKILTTEPINIYVNPTFLPDEIAKDYDTLWTEARMDKVIAAAKSKEVAIEINNRYRLPSLAFIQRAKAAGVKFTCGTNNTGPDLGRMEYCLDMIDAAKLGWSDFWTPKPRQ